MTDLSPAAQAVYDGFWRGKGYYEADEFEACLAAAIRAAADQVVPHLEEPDWGVCDYMKCDIELYTDHQRKRAELLAIATELEGHA